MQLSLPLLSRRLLLHSLVSLAPLLTPTSLPKHCLAAPLPPTSTPQSPSAPLLALIPLLPYGAPATRATLPLDLADAIEAEATSLERFHPTRNAATDPRLNGSWRLRYTNAPEITSLAKGLPLGFTLGKTYQPVDTSLGFFENQATIEHALRLARASTRVVGELRVAPGGTRNAAGVEDTEGNRVDVDFQRITFSVDELFGQPVSGLRKIVIPKNTPTAAQPSNDVTYLDGTMRMTRGALNCGGMMVRG